MNIEQIKQVLEGAPETAIEVCLYDYGDSEQTTYLNCEAQFYDNEEEFKWVDMELVDDFFHSRRRLSDLSTILAQHEEIERLRSVVESAREAIESLPEDSLGEVPDTDTEQEWFIRDELVYRMTKALKEQSK